LVAGIHSLKALPWLLKLGAYGGIYIVASLLWLWLAEGATPDRWDAVGGGLALIAAAIILFAPRG